MNGYAGLPEDLSALSDDELSALEEAAVAAFDEIAADDAEVSAESVAQAAQLADDIEAIRAESARRQEMALEHKNARAELHARIHGGGDAPANAGEESFATENGEDDEDEAAMTAGTHYSPGRTQPRNTVNTKGRKLNVSLSSIQARAPEVKGPRSDRESVLVASADIPGFAQGSRLTDMNQLVAAAHARVRTVGVTTRGQDAPRYTVASLNRQFKYNLDRQATPQQISDVLTAATNVDALVAAGGWCAPSEISYDLFNIVCEDGMLDLPTVGINRGGIRFPISPDFSSLSGNAALWRWNETQDIAAVTGTDQSGTKTCGRVPCATFTEERLECDGVCLTVGNLMDDAYPELIANHMKLLMAFHAHKMNLLRIQELVAASVAVSGFTGLGAVGESVINNVLGALEIQARDYREKFAMCEDAVLEVVLPRWILDMMRSDIRRKTALDLFAVTDSYLEGLFDALNIRVQFVGDWQVRTTGLPGTSTPLQAWPTQVQALIFAPGTFVLGNGLTLDLGVIRDSVLNATNDFTAAWMEECWLIAKLGHESRLLTINICANGRSGANDITACGL
jgi:hypothetical protein